MVKYCKHKIKPKLIRNHLNTKNADGIFRSKIASDKFHLKCGWILTEIEMFSFGVAKIVQMVEREKPYISIHVNS